MAEKSFAAAIIRGSLTQDGRGRFVSVPGMKYWQHPKPCAYCGLMFTVKRVQSAKQRFCGTSCSAKWRMRQPEIVARVHTKETHERIGQKVWHWLRSTAKGQANVRRFASLKPMRHASTRATVSQRLRAMGHRPPWTGGKGRGLTLPQRLLLAALGDGWTAEYIVPVNPRRMELPTCLFLDLANPSLMIAIEVDGATHLLAHVKAADARKVAFLRGLGWTVLRFWNQDILHWSNSETSAETSVSTTLKQHNIRLFR